MAKIIWMWAALACLGSAAIAQDWERQLKEANTLKEDGNYKEAFVVYERLLLARPAQLGNAQLAAAFVDATSCLQELGRQEDWDDFMAGCMARCPGDWRMALALHQALAMLPSYGKVVAGEFKRSGGYRHWGGHRQVRLYDRRTQLRFFRDSYENFLRDLPTLKSDEAAQYWLAYIATLQYGGWASWRMQKLSDFDAGLDLESAEEEIADPPGAPVDAEGRPIFYSLPASFAAAKNDGERWRWLLAEMMHRGDAENQAAARMQLADFLRDNFGVQTLQRFAGFYRSDSAQELGGLMILSNLGDDESMARLANGVQRFSLPDEFNYLTIYAAVAAGDSLLAKDAHWRLVEIHENRRQYDKALGWLQGIHKRWGKDEELTRRMAAITDNWCEFLPNEAQLAGRRPRVELCFRNARTVSLSVQRLDLPAMVLESQKRLANRQSVGRWSYPAIQQLPELLLAKGGEKYLLGTAQRWEQPLQARERHLDSVARIVVPVEDAGAYWLTATMANGNVARQMLLLEDIKLVNKTTDNAVSWQLLSAASGQPIANAKLDFFGWTTQWEGASRRARVITRRLAELTDEEGFVHLDAPRLREGNQHMQWLAEARTDSGQYGCYGYSHLSPQPLPEQSFGQHSVFGISDRPLYRPGHVMHYKFWAAQVNYELSGPNPLQGSTFVVELRNPRGETVLSSEEQADAFGGVEGSWTIPEDAPLGQYHLGLKVVGDKRFRGFHSFRVEEYKKPEFEVLVDLPEEAPLLGDQVTVGVSARYYFGGPVNEGHISVKVLRYDHQVSWWPIRPWDWLYGNGYGWLCEDYLWYPGWARWGWTRPAPPWLPPWRFANEPPEVVMQLEEELSADGSLQFKIDSAIAKELLGDRDHRYEVTAEVRDLSRRTIVGQGRIIVPRVPFHATLWLDRGYYRVGEPGMLFAQARRPDGGSVKGQGALQLLRIRYGADGSATESLVREWPLHSDDEGRAQQGFSASEPGQYRLAWILQDEQGRQGEGGVIVTIRGEGSDERDFRYNGLELIPDKAEYVPGETLQLLVNTEQADGVVMLFVRSVNGVLSRPQLLRLQGHSTVVPVLIQAADMPNFFVEAYTMAQGVFHNVMREIIVPPTKKVIEVEAVAAEKAKPGSDSELTLQLRDHDGRPVGGSVVVAVYDKSLDYIAGERAERDIRTVFWKWRRYHHLDRYSAVMSWSLRNMLREGEEGYPYIGIFGHWLASMDAMGGRGLAMSNRSRGGMRRAAVAAAPMMAMKAADAGMELAAMPAAEGFGAAAGGSGGGGEPEPVMRSNFADTALWVGKMELAADGLAKLKIPLPDSLTTWKVQVWAMGDGCTVGAGATEIIAAKDLMLRLQAPRFFVQKDEVLLSALVNNYLSTAKEVTVLLELPGSCLELLGAPRKVVRVASGGTARVDWPVRVREEGEALIRVKALSDEESDGMEQRFPVYVHGQDKQVASSGMLRPEESEARISIQVPAERRPESTRLTLRWSPSLAMAMVDALPYLLENPYGSTEHTLNRFLPAVLTQRMLLDMGLSLQDIAEKRANLNAQELGDARERAAQWGGVRQDKEPVFDEAVLAAMVRKGVEELSAMQCDDGGWGWFSGWGERSWPHTTAQILYGLQVAKQCRVPAPTGVMERGQQWLANYQQKELNALRKYDQDKAAGRDSKAHADNMDAMVYRVLAELGQNEPAMADYLYRDKTKLSLYGLSLVALGYHAAGDARLPELMRNLSQYVEQDDENQTAWLRIGNSGWWWYWYGDEIETHAAYLRLLAATDPGSALAPRLVKYLLNNRKHATYWRSTRDTAACLEAFAAYLKASGEDAPDMSVELVLDGRRVAESRITKETLFTGDYTLEIPAEQLSSGEHLLQIRKHGKGPLYYNSYLNYFTLEDPITAAGLELKVERRIFKLIRDDEELQSATALGQLMDKRVERYRRAPIAAAEVLPSGQLMEIELLIKSKNDYEYIVMEDFKAAGCEPVDLRSGYIPDAMGAYVEFRDNRVLFFFRAIGRGEHSLSYRLRAEIPGQFSALPAVINGMYAPELRGNSHENKVRIADQ